MTQQTEKSLTGAVQPLDAPAYYLEVAAASTEDELADFGRAWAEMCRVTDMQPLIVVPDGLKLKKLSDDVLDEVIVYLMKERQRRAIEVPRVIQSLEPVSTWEVMQEWLGAQTPLIYTVEAGMLPEIAYVPTADVAERVQHFRDTGRVLLDEYHNEQGRLHLTQREIPADTLTVTSVTDYLVKMPILRNVATGELFDANGQGFGSFE